MEAARLIRSFNWQDAVKVSIYQEVALNTIRPVVRIYYLQLRAFGRGGMGNAEPKVKGVTPESANYLFDVQCQRALIQCLKIWTGCYHFNPDLMLARVDMAFLSENDGSGHFMRLFVRSRRKGGIAGLLE